MNIPFKRTTYLFALIAIVILLFLGYLSSIFILEAGDVFRLMLDSGISSEARNQIASFGFTYVLIAILNFLYVYISEYLVAFIGRDLSVTIFSRNLEKRQLHFLSDHNLKIETLLSAGLNNFDSFFTRPVLSLCQSSTVILSSIIGIFQTSPSFIYILAPLSLLVLFASRYASKRAGYYSKLILKSQQNHFTFVKSAINLSSQLSHSSNSKSFSSTKLFDLDSKKRIPSAKASILSQSPKIIIEILIAIVILLSSIELNLPFSNSTNAFSIIGSSIAFMYRLTPSIPSFIRSFLVIFSFKDTLKLIYQSLLPIDSIESSTKLIKSSKLPNDVILFASQVDLPISNDKSIHLTDFELNYRFLYRLKGSSGSGKSTLMKYLSGLFGTKYDYPTIYLNNQIISSVFSSSQRTYQYYLPQSSHMLPTSIANNICLSTHLCRDYDRYQYVVSKLKLSSIISTSLDSYIDDYRDWSKILSGGQIQLVAIARLAYCNPVIAYLDESFSAMDQFLATTTLKTLRKLCPHTTFVLTTHDETFAKNADRVICIENQYAI